MAAFVRSSLAAACLVAGHLVLAAGCGGADGPATRQSPADRALADPWNYGPQSPAPNRGLRRGGADAKAADANRNPLAAPSDNGVTDRNGLKRDLDHVFNP